MKSSIIKIPKQPFLSAILRGRRLRMKPQKKSLPRYSDKDRSLSFVLTVLMPLSLRPQNSTITPKGLVTFWGPRSFGFKHLRLFNAPVAKNYCQNIATHFRALFLSLYLSSRFLKIPFDLKGITKRICYISAYSAMFWIFFCS